MSWFKSNEAIVVDFNKREVVRKQKIISDVESEFEVIAIKKISYPTLSEVEEEETNVGTSNISNISK